MSGAHRPGGRNPRGGAWRFTAPPPPEDPYARLIREHAQRGLRDLEAHLARHAAFEEYLRGGRSEAPHPDTSDGRNDIDPPASIQTGRTVTP